MIPGLSTNLGLISGSLPSKVKSRGNGLLNLDGGKINLSTTDYTPGDLAFLIENYNSNQSSNGATLPAGWTLVNQYLTTPSGGGSHFSAIKQLDGSESGEISFNGSTGRITAQLVIIEGGWFNLPASPVVDSGGKHAYGSGGGDSPLVSLDASTVPSDNFGLVLSGYMTRLDQATITPFYLESNSGPEDGSQDFYVGAWYGGSKTTLIKAKLFDFNTTREVVNCYSKWYGDDSVVTAGLIRLEV